MRVRNLSERSGVNFSDLLEKALEKKFLSGYMAHFGWDYSSHDQAVCRPMAGSQPTRDYAEVYQAALREMDFFLEIAARYLVDSVFDQSIDKFVGLVVSVRTGLAQSGNGNTLPFKTTAEQLKQIPNLILAMSAGGIDSQLLTALTSQAQIHQGIFDLMYLWVTETDPLEKAEIIADLVKTIDESEGK